MQASVAESKQGEGHVLAVHTISHAAVSGNAVAEVLDIKCTLEAGREEAAERRDEGGEAGEDQEVELVRRVRDRGTTSKLARKEIDEQGLA